MIRICYSEEHHNGAITYKLTTDGHANYAEKGKDIVCSAVSVLVQTLANYCIEQYNGSWEHSDGHSVVSATDPYAIGYIGTAFGVTMSGMRLLEEAYPEYVQVV